MQIYLWAIVSQQLKKLTVAVIYLLCLFANIGYAELGKKEDGALVQNTTHVYSKVNPEAGDFLWELEGKPAPKYSNVETQALSFPRKRESTE